MNLLSGYGSDSDEDKEVTPTAPAAPPVISKNIVTKQTNIKKRKLNISVLPIEIQRALTQSDSNLDSDDEDAASKPSNTTSHTNSINSNSGMKGLLSMLPQPKTASSSSAPASLYTQLASQKKASTNSTPLTSNTKPLPTLKSTTQTISAKLNETNNADDDDDIDTSALFNPSKHTQSGSSSSLFTFFETKQKPSQAQVLLSSTGGSSQGPKPDICSISRSSTPNYTMNNNSIYSTNNTNTTTSHTYPISNESVPDYPSSYTTTDTTSSTTTFTTTSAISKRKRERDIEHALSQGNLDIVEQHNLIKNNIITVDNTGSWDSSKYEAQKQKEYDVLKKYNLVSSGADGSGGSAINQPSKQQNRKHHINSLAFNAAKAELALLDSKATRNKTKFETQSKYGW